MLITICCVCVLASGRVIGDTRVINCLGQTSSSSSSFSLLSSSSSKSPSSTTSKSSSQAPLFAQNKCLEDMNRVSKCPNEFKSLIYDLIARPHPIDFAKSVSVDFPHHASCKTLIEVKGPSSGPQLLASEPSEFGPALGPAGLLDFLLRALWALRPLDSEISCG